MRIQRCKGTQDLNPGEMKKFRFIEGIFRDTCIKWGYDEVRTPTLEYLHLFTSTGTLTPGRLGKVYSFLDWDGWSGERVVMRPDGTIPIARMYIDTVGDNSTAKLFYVTNVFVFEETGTESREQWQCGVELIGAGSTVADVELISLALDVLKKTGIKNTRLKLSHAGLIRTLLEKFGLDRDEQAKVFDDILDGDEKILTRMKTEKPELSRLLTPLLDLEGKSSGFLKNMKALFDTDWPEFGPLLDNFIEAVEMLEAAGIEYSIDIASGRGFEYYTGIIYQLMADGDHIGGGGRYDALIPLIGGDEIPASGFALYLDQLMEKLKPWTITGKEPAKILVQAGKDSNLRDCFALATGLRDAGYIVEFDLGGDEPTGISWLIEVIGEKPVFFITSKRTDEKAETGSLEEVLKIIAE